MKNLVNIKRLLLTFTLMSLWGCGGGNVSVIPSSGTFVQEGEEIVAKMDILWVIDNSGSMNDFQESVEANLASFMENFTDKGFDFRIAVTVSDAWEDLDFTDYSNLSLGASTTQSRFIPSDPGTGSSRVLSSDEDSAVLIQKFQEIVDNVGTSGDGDERSFQSFQAAMLNTDNQADGFFRSDAHLAIIIVSDEEDNSWSDDGRIYNASGCPHSSFGNMFRHNNADPLIAGFADPLCTANLESVAYYKTFLQNNSSPVLGVTVHNMAISPGDAAPPGSTFPSGASTMDCRRAILPGESSAYQRFFGIRTNELADLTGGTKSSLCGNFADSLDNIAQTIIQRTVEFPLDGIPADPNEISVKVTPPVTLAEPNPVEVVVPKDNTNGWSYKATSNSLVFHGDAIPEQGATILVEFDKAGL